MKTEQKNFRRGRGLLEVAFNSQYVFFLWWGLPLALVVPLTTFWISVHMERTIEDRALGGMDQKI